MHFNLDVEFDNDNFPSNSEGNENNLSHDIEIGDWNEMDAFSYEAIMQMTYQTNDEADQFYNMYDKVGFVIKDLYNKIGSEIRKETNAEGAINYFSRRKDFDRMFYHKYCIDGSSTNQDGTTPADSISQQTAKLCVRSYKHYRPPSEEHNVGDLLLDRKNHLSNNFKSNEELEEQGLKEMKTLVKKGLRFTCGITNTRQKEQKSPKGKLFRTLHGKADVVAKSNNKLRNVRNTKGSKLGFQKVGAWEVAIYLLLDESRG
ncbi:hypothetical protein ACH5RR_038951 [Cinchona calisaya]|uniref:Protein FAR1-RELATED SEQUENCE n=1 Tax=Cinchona calisaya TaxID=153742 RepID=A0ABD2XXC2_9GENT